MCLNVLLQWVIKSLNYNLKIWFHISNVLMAMCNQHTVSQKTGHPVGFGDPVLNSETGFWYSSLFTLLWECECVMVFCGETQIICSLCEVRDRRKGKHGCWQEWWKKSWQRRETRKGSHQAKKKKKRKVSVRGFPHIGSYGLPHRNFSFFFSKATFW